MSRRTDLILSWHGKAWLASSKATGVMQSLDGDDDCLLLQ